jgi:magnesium-transporting ATPase (P-type)
MHVQTLHFNSDNKRMTVVFPDLQTGKNLVFMKGAPERVIGACIYDNRLEMLRLVEQFASEGLVVPTFYVLIEESSCFCIQNFGERTRGSRE